MKRPPRKTSSKSQRDARTIEPNRLATVRGGRGLGISVQLPALTTAGMSTQHNEMLVRF